MRRHGKDWMVISDMIESRTPKQVRSHAQKYFKRCEITKATNLRHTPIVCRENPCIKRFDKSTQYG